MSEGAIRMIASALTITIGAIAPAMAIGWIVARAMQALGRNPEAEPAIRLNLILGLAFAEAIAIYALVVALAIKFT